MNTVKRLFAVVALIIPAGILMTCSGEVETKPAPAAGTQPRALVLQPHEGEVLVLRRPPIDGEVVIKVDPKNAGSRRMAMGTQRLPVQYRVPVHQHEHQDEILFVHEGKGTGILGEERVPVEPGTTIYVPQGMWHGVENTSDAPAQIIWVIAPPGLESFFRDIGTPPGTDRKPPTPEEMAEIHRRHGIIVKME